MRTAIGFWFCGAVLATLPFLAPSVSAEKLCLKAKPKGGKVKITKTSIASDQKCPKGSTELLDTSVLIGPQGPAGADGQLRVYGDGSGGPKNLPGDQDEVPLDENAQYTDVTVGKGVELYVSSGEVIRCTGSFTNYGLIRVRVAAYGGRRGGADHTLIINSLAPANPGISFGAPLSSGIVEGPGYPCERGLGGVKLEPNAARALRYPGPLGGGGGSCGQASGCHAPDGGGTLAVLCRGAIVNYGTISADGASGRPGEGGGGGGGVIILASKTSVSNAAGATISAAGGAGGASNTATGASGGGGGGVVHLLAPAYSNKGTISVAGGAAGAAGAAGSITQSPVGGGGGGGASGGDGGHGGSVTEFGDPEPADPGYPGQVFMTAMDPTAEF